MRLTLRDLIATALLLAIGIPYVGYLVAGEMPLVEDARGMSAVGLLLGAVMFPHGAQKVLGWFGGYGFGGTYDWMTNTVGVPGVFAAIAIEHLGGAVSRVGPQDTAFGHRDAQHSLLVLRMWQDPAESEKNIDWARRCYRTAEPFLKAGARYICAISLA